MSDSSERVFRSLPTPTTGFDDDWQRKQTVAEQSTTTAVTLPELPSSGSDYMRLRGLGLCRSVVMVQDGRLIIDPNEGKTQVLYGPGQKRIGKYTAALWAIADEWKADRLTFSEYYSAVMAAKDEVLEDTVWARYMPNQEG